MSENDNLPKADGAPLEVNTPLETNTKPVFSENNTTASSENIHNSLASSKTEEHVEHIEASNAEDSENDSNTERHDIEVKDFHAMSMDKLVAEFNRLLNHHKIQTISKQINQIKTVFNTKFNALLEEKKEDFINGGGDALDFYYTNDNKKLFNQLYNDYKSAINTYYQERELTLKQNLQNRLTIIEDIKGLLNLEENITSTYKHFKELQQKWRNAGPIPRDKYNNAWNTYHHHVERFYDFLHLNNDLRDMDFKHNYEQKLKIITQAEELAKDSDINRSFKTLQTLHKLWKEELGPVAKEHRETIWERFSNATKTIHEKRQAYYADLEKAYEKNLEKKEQIIAKIQDITTLDSGSHDQWQKRIKDIETLREDFFNAGKVPLKVNEATWSKFKDAVRAFNKGKNTFYKSLKKEQFENLQKKKELIQIAQENMDSSDFEVVTPLMKKIQSNWKNIGHVPRKDSDKIWKQFKAACNHYFDRLHESRKAENQHLYDAYDKKVSLLESVKALEFTDNLTSINTLKSKIAEWQTIGKVPDSKRFIDGKFYKSIDEAFNKLDMDKAKLDMVKFESKLEHFTNSEDDTKRLQNEQNFIRKKINDLKGEINQLENNLAFFSNVKDDNPVVKEVRDTISKHKSQLDIWKNKLHKIKTLLKPN